MFTIAFKRSTAELAAVRKKHVSLLVNFDALKTCLEVLEKQSQIPLPTNFNTFEEIQNRFSRANKLLVFNVVELSIDNKDDLLVTTNEIFNNLLLTTKRIGKTCYKTSFHYDRTQVCFSCERYLDIKI